MTNRYSETDKIYERKWSKQRYDVAQACVKSLEEFAWTLQERWGKGKLERLASPSLAVAFKQAKQNYATASQKDDINYMVQKAKNLIQGWTALENYALKQGHKPTETRIWYAISPPECGAFTYAIVRSYSDMQSVDKKSADRTYTLDEIATIIYNFENDNKAATEVKSLFSGSEITSIGDNNEKRKLGKNAKQKTKNKEPYYPFDDTDKIPF